MRLGARARHEALPGPHPGPLPGGEEVERRRSKPVRKWQSSIETYGEAARRRCQKVVELSNVDPQGPPHARSINGRLLDRSAQRAMTQVGWHVGELRLVHGSCNAGALS